MHKESRGQQARTRYFCPQLPPAPAGTRLPALPLLGPPRAGPGPRCPRGRQGPGRASRGSLRGLCPAAVASSPPPVRCEPAVPAGRPGPPPVASRPVPARRRERGGTPAPGRPRRGRGPGRGRSGGGSAFPEPERPLPAPGLRRAPPGLGAGDSGRAWPPGARRCPPEGPGRAGVEARPVRAGVKGGPGSLSASPSLPVLTLGAAHARLAPLGRAPGLASPGSVPLLTQRHGQGPAPRICHVSGAGGDPVVSNKLQPRAEPRFCGWGKYRGTSAGTLPDSFEPPRVHRSF